MKYYYIQCSVGPDLYDDFGTMGVYTNNPAYIPLYTNQYEYEFNIYEWDCELLRDFYIEVMNECDHSLAPEDEIRPFISNDNTITLYMSENQYENYLWDNSIIYGYIESVATSIMILKIMNDKYFNIDMDNNIIKYIYLIYMTLLDERYELYNPIFQLKTIYPSIDSPTDVMDEVKLVNNVLINGIQSRLRRMDINEPNN